MSNINPYIEIAALNRVADLVESGTSLPLAFRITALELNQYYKAWFGTKVEPFDLTQWVLAGSPSKDTPDEPSDSEGSE